MLTITLKLEQHILTHLISRYSGNIYIFTVCDSSFIISTQEISQTNTCLSLSPSLSGALPLFLSLVQILHIPLSVLMQIPPREWRPDFPKADINITGHCDGVIFMEAQKEVM